MDNTIDIQDSIIAYVLEHSSTRQKLKMVKSVLKTQWETLTDGERATILRCSRRLEEQIS